MSTPNSRGCIICHDEFAAYREIGGIGQVNICPEHSLGWQRFLINIYEGVHVDFLVAAAAFRRMMSGWPDVSGSLGTDRTTALQFIDAEREMAAIWEEFVQDERAQLKLDTPPNGV